MRHPATLALIALLALPLAAGAQAPSSPADEKDVTVPISTLVLFTSGVGYFQHDGVVDGNGKMELN